MVEFVKISPEQEDVTRVTLRIYRDEFGDLLGRVSTLAYDDRGAIDVMSTASADPPVEASIVMARQLANFKASDVDVIDENQFWRLEWGPLRYQ